MQRLALVLVLAVVGGCSKDPATGGDCSEDSDCESGYLCIGGECTLVCSQNSHCSDGQVCKNGSCVPCEFDADCDDGVPCTDDSCDNGTCESAPVWGSCLIDGACYVNGAVDPAGECRTCDVNVSATVWTPKATGEPCGDTAGECAIQDTCDATGACADNGFRSAGTLCGNGPEVCSGQDTCDGSGVCQPNDLAPGTACGDGPTECSGQDTCDANGDCQPNHLAAGTDCGDGVCDACDGAGACRPNSTDHTDCPLCQMCSNGACVSQSSGQDLKGDCADRNCSEFIYGWNGATGACHAYAGTTPVSGACDGSGACAGVTASCTGMGAVAYSCDAGCRESCPTGGAVVDYDQAAEVCYTDGLPHGCGLSEICSTSGQCLYVGSCPVLYTWDGADHVFESDVFPSGKLGLQISSGFRKPYPHDNYLLRHDPAASNGSIDLRIVEERHEANYLDHVRLYTVDAPDDRTVVSEILSVLPADNIPSNELLHTVALDMANPISMVRLDTGEDVSALLAASDKQIVVLNDDNNTFEWKTLEIDLGDLSGATQIKLVIDARLVFPSTPEGYALARDLDPTNLRTRLEVQDTDGTWIVVPDTLAVLTRPKEFTRVHVMDISGIFLDGYRMRLSYLYYTFIDSIHFDVTVDQPVEVTEVPFESAFLDYHGPDARTADPHLYEFDYGVPSDRPYVAMPGHYTRYGEVTPLLAQADDEFVIFAIGDQVQLLFTDPGPAPAGKNRRFVLYTNGYYKTYKSPIDHTVEPLPFADMTNFPYEEFGESYPSDPDHATYLEEWNTRVVP
jgi:hypothetical protein